MTHETPIPTLSYRPTQEMLRNALQIILSEIDTQTWVTAMHRAVNSGACQVDAADYAAVEAWEQRTGETFSWPDYTHDVAEEGLPTVDGTSPGDTNGFGLYGQGWAARIAVDYVDAME